MVDLLTTRHEMTAVYEADPDAENGRRRVKRCRVCHMEVCPILTAQAVLDRLTGRA